MKPFKTTITASLLFIFTTGHSQDTIYNHGHSFFDQLQSNRISSGYLIERAMAAGGDFFGSDGSDPSGKVRYVFADFLIKNHYF